MIAAAPPEVASTPPRLTPPWKRRRARAFRSASAIGIESIRASERDAARLWPFTIWGLRRFCEREYLDEFYGTIDDEYGGFAALPFPASEKRVIAPRVAASIRIIAAFSAWYRVAGTIIARGFVAAAVLGVASNVLTIILAPHGISGSVAGVASSAAVTIFLWVAAAGGVAMLPHRWPGDALALIIAAAAFATLTELGWSGEVVFPIPGAVAACVGIAVFFGVGALSLIAGQLVAQRVTRRKIRRFPEEEIIESTAYLLTRIERMGPRWRLPENRTRIVALLEWIARRFERNLVRPYRDGASSSDAIITTAAAERGEAFRAQKIRVALPGGDTIESLRSFLWSALRNAGSNDWDAMQRVAIVPAASKPVRALQLVSSAAGIVVPLLVAVAFSELPWLKDHPEYDVLRNNVSAACIGWSVLSVLALLNPRQFDAQFSAAKTLGDILKQG